MEKTATVQNFASLGVSGVLFGLLKAPFKERDVMCKGSMYARHNVGFTDWFPVFGTE